MHSQSSLRRAAVSGLLAAIAVFAAGSRPAQSAEIRENKNGERVLEGTIVPGDYEKVRDFLENHIPDQRSNAHILFLASPGGDLAEAMKIGHLVRQLKMMTHVTDRDEPTDIHKKAAAEVGIKDFKNFLCTSACFFVFVAGVRRWPDLPGIPTDPALGIHRPFFSASDMKGLSADQALASASELRTVVENYLREMSVPAKYADLMFSIPKDDIRWISAAEFANDFAGIIPGLRDWVAARCDTRTEAEKIEWNDLKYQPEAERTPVERIVADQLFKKVLALARCTETTIEGLSDDAYQKMFAKAPPSGPPAAGP